MKPAGAWIRLAPTEILLRKTQKNAADLTPVLDGPIANRVHAMFGKIFASEGAYIGSRWAPLKPRTLAAKARVNRAGMGTLRRYNILWASLVKRSNPSGYRIVTPQSLLMGTGVAYAAPHHVGAGSLPERKLVPDEDDIPRQDLEAWESLIARHLETA